MGSWAKKHQSRLTGMHRAIVLIVPNEKTRKRLKFEELRKTIKPKEESNHEEERGSGHGPDPTRRVP